MPRASTRKGTLAQHNQGGFAGAGQGRAFLLPVPGAESSSTRPFGKIAPSIGATGDDAAKSSSEETGGAGYGKALRTLWERLKEHPLARVGPGLITCVVDDDPSGIATYSHGSPVQVQHALDDPAFIPADGRGPIHVRADRSRDRKGTGRQPQTSFFALGASDRTGHASALYLARSPRLARMRQKRNCQFIMGILHCPSC